MLFTNTIYLLIWASEHEALTFRIDSLWRRMWLSCALVVVSHAIKVALTPPPGLKAGSYVL